MTKFVSLCFENAFRIQSHQPSAAKAAFIAAHGGTAEAVPFPESIPERCSQVMRIALAVALALCMSHQVAWAGVYQHGTVVRMRMVDCLPVHRGFMSVMSGGAPGPITTEVCPEYTLLSDKVVFVIVGKSSDQLVPLADVVDFRFNKNELALRLDDARHESKFSIKEMILRSDWELIQKHITEQIATPPRPTDTNVALRTRD